MRSTLASFHDNCERGTHLNSVKYPSLESINAFMKRLTAKLPPDYCIEANFNCVCMIAPYNYTGCDYALILHAMFPKQCAVDLSRLCWSPHPLTAQLRENLEEFCRAVKRLDTPDAPLLSLESELLVPSATCTLHHLKVQYWLYMTSQNFPPDPAFDPTSARAVLRWWQLGEPFLRRSRCRTRAKQFDTEDKQKQQEIVQAVSGYEAEDVECFCEVLNFRNFENDPDVYCRSVEHTSCMDTRKLDEHLGPYFAWTLENIEAASNHQKADSSGRTLSDCGPSSSCNVPENAHNSNSQSNHTDAKPKPWLNYSKPWRVPALAQAKDKHGKTVGPRRQVAALSRNPSTTVLAQESSNLYQQYVTTRKAITALRTSLDAVRREMVEEVMAGRKILSFERYAEMLNKATSDL